MCVILLQIQEIFMFYFCELYHEIIKQEILRKGGGGTKRASSSVYIIPSTYTGENFGLLIYLTLGKENYGKNRLNQSKHCSNSN